MYLVYAPVHTSLSGDDAATQQTDVLLSVYFRPSGIRHLFLVKWYVINLIYNYYRLFVIDLFCGTESTIIIIARRNPEIAQRTLGFKMLISNPYRPLIYNKIMMV